MDIARPVRDTGWVLKPGSSRERLAGTLKAAFAEGLLSEQTLSHRLGLLFGPRLIEPRSVIGDLALRAPRRPISLASLISAATAVRESLEGIIDRGRSAPAPLVLALDWSGGQEALVLGRAPSCDVALTDQTVSRRHARLVFRDCAWIVNDLASKNGVTVNGTKVGRCQLRPGDRLGLGLQLLDID
jgi:DNA segregation ATPase FtsK/SpoIIIE, S-DNA-T family